MLGINKILGFIRRQVGLRTDVASATGSLHAKVVDVKTYLSGIKKKGFLSTSFISNTTAYQTALDVSGSGKLDRLLFTANTTSVPTLKLTIDGNVVYDNQTLSSLSAGAYIAPGILFPFSATAGKNWAFANEAETTSVNVQYTPMGMQFKSSLKIEVKGNNTASVTTNIGYSLD